MAWVTKLKNEPKGVKARVEVLLDSPRPVPTPFSDAASSPLP